MSQSQQKRPRRNRRRPRSNGQPQKKQPQVSEKRQVAELPTEPASYDEDNIFSVLIPELRQAISDCGYVNPSPIQSQCIKPLIDGRDLLGGAQTGTGKTAAFTLPLLQRIVLGKRRYSDKVPRVLILTPTRELAAQIDDNIQSFSKYVDIRHTVIFGGVGQRPQERAMSRGVDFLVATPGRLLDLVNQGFIDLSGVESFVLDEADRMLDMGFIRDIRKVVEKLPKKRHTLFFSATLAPDIVKLARTMLTNPESVSIAPDKPTVDKIDQKILFVDKDDKDSLLAKQIRDYDRVIVFAQMKYAANRIAEKLDKVGITAAAIHGNKSQGARTRALDGFRNGTVQVLVATDIAARGIDVDGVQLVVNYHLPKETETYVHRIGRTARAGREGKAISFCEAQERDQWRAIERAIKKKVQVDTDHAYHSERAMNAKGNEAKPPPKKQHQGRRCGGNQRKNSRSKGRGRR